MAGVSALHERTKNEEYIISEQAIFYYMVYGRFSLEADHPTSVSPGPICGNSLRLFQ